MSYKVFAVEDDPTLLSAVKDLIADRGYMLDAPWQNSTSIRSFRFGTVRADFQKSEIVRSGHRVTLSERENRLLQFLVLHRGTPVSRDMLLEHVWGYRLAPLTRTVDVTIRRLRQKIEPFPAKPVFIITVPGLGYRFRSR